jgi:ABC-type sugar transport system permease subunit
MSPFVPSSLVAVGLSVVMLVTVFVHITFACGVFLDSRRQVRELQRATFLVPGFVWALATVVGGVVTVGLYWAIHHSTLRLQQH